MDEFLRAYDDVLSKWPVPVEALDIESRYGTTRVNACGPLDGSPVVLLPGAGATSTVWFANVAALSRRHRVYAIDPIGQPGRSVVGATPIRRVDDLLESLGAVLDGLGLDEVHLIGHSYGAMVALAFALRSPDRVGKLVLLDPNSCFAGIRPAYLLRAIPLLLRPTYERQRRFVEWETGGIGVDAAWLDLLARGAAEYPSSKTVVPRKPKTSALASLTGATAIFAGNSKVHNSSRVAACIEAELPNIRTVTIADCAHHAMPMHPSEEIDRAILDALG